MIIKKILLNFSHFLQEFLQVLLNLSNTSSPGKLRFAQKYILGEW